ncbi:MAG: CpXC domain-containing protein [Aeriscardovia sp.]|nr:CpXC domain-containing protein [Aeriscardovia sp.]
MSSFRKIKITCPDCNTEGEYTVWDSVNVDLDPELKSKVMDGSLFTWVCPKCKKSFNAPYSFLYHDMAHNFMVYFESEKSHIIPFAEYLRVMENGLDMNTITAMAVNFREDNPKMNILFDRMTEDRNLLFSVLEMSNDIWVFTEQKHIVSYDEYLRVCEKI